MEQSKVLKRPNPTRWKAVYIPEELAKDLEDVSAQMGLSGIGEAAAVLIMLGAQAMNAIQPEPGIGEKPEPEILDAQVRAVDLADAGQPGTF